MYLFKNTTLLKQTQKKMADEIGISQSYLSKIINRRKKCSKLVAYAITKNICSEKEINDFFERSI